MTNSVERLYDLSDEAIAIRTEAFLRQLYQTSHATLAQRVRKFLRRQAPAEPILWIKSRGRGCGLCQRPGEWLSLDAKMGTNVCDTCWPDRSKIAAGLVHRHGPPL